MLALERNTSPTVVNIAIIVDLESGGAEEAAVICPGLLRQRWPNCRIVLAELEQPDMATGEGIAEKELAIASLSCSVGNVELPIHAASLLILYGHIVLAYDKLLDGERKERKAGPASCLR